MNDNFDSTRARLRGTMKRMIRMAEKTGVGWRVWLGFFAAVGLLFWYVWLFWTGIFRAKHWKMNAPSGVGYTRVPVDYEGASTAGLGFRCPRGWYGAQRSLFGWRWLDGKGFRNIVARVNGKYARISHLQGFKCGFQYIRLAPSTAPYYDTTSNHRINSRSAQGRRSSVAFEDRSWVTWPERWKN